MRVKELVTLYNNKRIPILEVKQSYNAPDYKVLNNPDIIVSFMNKYLHSNREVHEKMYVIFLDTKCKLIGYTELNAGLIDSSIVDKRRLYQMALQCCATNIVVLHNHPSGDSTPSKYDNNVTEEIKNGCKLLGVSLVDHIIIGMENYYSYKEHSNIL